MNPDKTEAIKIANLASSCRAISFLKESSAMKIDIVKPIPAKNPVPIICPQLLLNGKLLSPLLMAIRENKLIPNTFPNANPPMIPKPKLLNNPSTIPALNKILVLANAKMGIMMKLTGVCK